jgi:hypothetical protein
MVEGAMHMPMLCPNGTFIAKRIRNDAILVLRRRIIRQA